MTRSQQIVRRSELLNRRTIDRRTAEEVGRVDRLWLDADSGRAIGFTCKSGLLGTKKTWFAWAQVDTVGENVFVTINPELPPLHQPEQAVCPIGLEVLTDSGNKAGTVVDYLFDVQTGSVTNYLFKSSGWRGVLDGIYLLPVGAISTMGSKRAIVSEAAVSEPVQYAEGLHKKVGLVAEFLHEDFDKTLQNVADVKRGAQNLADKLQDKALEVRDVAQEKVAELKRQRQESASPPPTPDPPESDLL
ncbi:PRC-barrel domain-containing protein [Microcoleus sp. LEGE 07076]|uniref:PRC-barrel domain-containing protein n=1 Tax=Microcoleus sp. LEGE 07076 TaxID=915322 RepID=UPI00187DEA59|nr:PRC-barrel domain-containing protein [Microcoleus sp. LEGE 07076]MBE9184303.1 PRC-barrel domain-containing protein [Microcoleus sp. LEGE 07076]